MRSLAKRGQDRERNEGREGREKGRGQDDRVRREIMAGRRKLRAERAIRFAVLQPLRRHEQARAALTVAIARLGWRGARFHPRMDMALDRDGLGEEGREEEQQEEQRAFPMTGWRPLRRPWA